MKMTMEPMIVTNTNHDNRIDDYVAIIANGGNNENLVQEHCPSVNTRIEQDKRIDKADNNGGRNNSSCGNFDESDDLLRSEKCHGSQRQIRPCRKVSQSGKSMTRVMMTIFVVVVIVFTFHRRKR